MIINDLDGYYIVFDTKNWNTELDTLSNRLMPFSLHEIAIEYRIAARLAPSCEPKNMSPL